jgi:hypothetical protein
VPNQALAHWSKDFVEHLRTVHFALIAISAGLILLVGSSKEYNAGFALVQAEEILDLKHQWSLDWVAQHSDTSPDFLTDEYVKSTHSKAKHLSALIELPQSGRISLTGELQNTESKKVQVLDCLFPQENWYQDRDKLSDWSPTTFPRTLAEFEAWWNSLDSTSPVYVPKLISKEWSFDSGASHSTFEPIFSANPDEKGTSHIKVELYLSDIPYEHGTHLEVGVAGEPKGVRYAGVTLWGVGDRQETEIPILTFAKYVVTRGTLSKLFHNLRPGPFKKSFGDLSVATRDETDLPLEDIKEFLHDEAAKGPEVFEAFGMKFPAGQITFWGIALLLSVQMYFLVYLRQLVGKLKADDAGWDVPWIAMSFSGLSKSLFFMSSVVLPFAASILLAWQATFRVSSGYWERTEHWIHFLAPFPSWPQTVLLKFVLLILAATMSGFLGLRSWKYRPQIAPEPPTPPSCPGPMFW